VDAESLNIIASLGSNVLRAATAPYHQWIFAIKLRLGIKGDDLASEDEKSWIAPPLRICLEAKLDYHKRGQPVSSPADTSTDGDVLGWRISCLCPWRRHLSLYRRRLYLTVQHVSSWWLWTVPIWQIQRLVEDEQALLYREENSTTKSLNLRLSAVP
jgi:hypothetical protein